MDKRLSLNRSLYHKAILRAVSARSVRRVADASGSPERSRVAWGRFKYVMTCVRALRAKVRATSTPVGRSGRALTGAAKRSVERRNVEAFRAARSAERRRYFTGGPGGSPAQGF